MKSQSRKKMSDRLDLSVVMPAYNEEVYIEKTINRIDSIVKQTGLKYELVVVDDGSIDNTRKKIHDYAKNNGHVKVIGYNKNMGKGFAIKKGFLQCKGNAVVFADSDLDIDPSQITTYLKTLKVADIAIASKWHPKSRVEIPSLRRFLSYSFSMLVRLLTGIRVKDTQTGLKAVKREALEKAFRTLAVKKYAFDVELLVLANLYGLRVAELPVNIRMHCLFSFRDIWRMFLDLLGITYRLRVSKWYKRTMK